MISGIGNQLRSESFTDNTIDYKQIEKITENFSTYKSKYIYHINAVTIKTRHLKQYLK